MDVASKKSACATTGMAWCADSQRPSAYQRLALGVVYADGDPRRSSSGKRSLGRRHVALGVSATVGVDGEGRARGQPVGVLALGVAR
jgi:hypothetical protein